MPASTARLRSAVKEYNALDSERSIISSQAEFVQKTVENLQGRTLYGIKTDGVPLFYRFTSTAYQHVLADLLTSDERNFIAHLARMVVSMRKHYGLPFLVLQVQLRGVINEDNADDNLEGSDKRTKTTTAAITATARPTKQRSESSSGSAKAQPGSLPSSDGDVVTKGNRTGGMGPGGTLSQIKCPDQPGRLPQTNRAAIEEGSWRTPVIQPMSQVTEMDEDHIKNDPLSDPLNDNLLADNLLADNLLADNLLAEQLTGIAHPVPEEPVADEVLTDESLSVLMREDVNG
ncbi:hypothetical protein GNI_054460 [Gregarina niphandrodes]|uniref:Uncharacterized protein n=1 Tax=Gregarina niphandrodes TaxID=110365 RepID=A0A023B930_GRENI|nr:hypothetical protein GNI_054460 [Gregarina niphandrodes]EZG70693.1 hypothetical protein GNI_054460 [Gregarina niphandrodes]|eukprot:XP_011129876.1 hypothetical protein GNI_054460 [Gregarina niphandrodes]